MELKDPKKEAKRLFDRMVVIEDKLCKYPMCFDTAKATAFICVDEKLDLVPYINNTPSQTFRRMYLMDVRTELNQLKF